MKQVIMMAMAMIFAQTVDAGMRRCDMTMTRLPGNKIVHIGDKTERVCKALKRENCRVSTRVDNGDSWTDIYFNGGQVGQICRETKY